MLNLLLCCRENSTLCFFCLCRPTHTETKRHTNTHTDLETSSILNLFKVTCGFENPPKTKTEVCVTCVVAAHHVAIVVGDGDEVVDGVSQELGVVAVLHHVRAHVQTLHRELHQRVQLVAARASLREETGLIH